MKYHFCASRVCRMIYLQLHHEDVVLIVATEYVHEYDDVRSDQPYELWSRGSRSTRGRR